jgi:hypothetical protein
VRAQLATAPGKAGAANEDFAAATATAAVLLDGATTPPGYETGCVHGVAWFARTLGALLLAAADDPASGSLTDCLRGSISLVGALHGSTCDLTHPGTPTATVVAIRVTSGHLEYLVLADSSLVLRAVAGDTEVIADHRLDEALAGSRAALALVPPGDPARPAAFRAHVAAVQRQRNAAGGFWVASPDPAVADHALTGVRPLAALRSALLVSDGVTRLAEEYGMATFAELTQAASANGPARLIRWVREAEASDPDGTRWKRGKVSDDATAVYCDEWELET